MYFAVSRIFTLLVFLKIFLRILIKKLYDLIGLRYIKEPGKNLGTIVPRIALNAGILALGHCFSKLSDRLEKPILIEWVKKDDSITLVLNSY